MLSRFVFCLALAFLVNEGVTDGSTTGSITAIRYEDLDVTPYVSNREPKNKGPAPEQYDWRNYNAVSPVKDHFSGAAASVASNIESHAYIYLQKSPDLSPQFIRECTPEVDESGQLLNGPEKLINLHLLYNKTLYERDYPTREIIGKCYYRNETLPSVPVLGYYRKMNTTEEEMVDLLYQNGPLIATINFSSMIYYRTSIDMPPAELCPSTPGVVDYSVLIVGYGALRMPNVTVPYWIIQNSWGKKWGVDGYYYLWRGHNACGITSDVAFAYVN